MRLNAEQLEILGMAADFAGAEIAPHGEAWDAARALPGDLFATLGELGFTGMTVPEEQGGLEFSPALWTGVLTAIGGADASAGLAVGTHVAAAGCVAEIAPENDALTAMAGGELRCAVAIREGDLDVDPDAFETTSDGATVSGRKSWVVEPRAAGAFLVLAREGEGVSAFLVRNGDGVSVENRRTTMGLRAVELADVVFDGAAAERIGGAGEGARVLAAWTQRENLVLASLAVGVAASSRAHAVRYAQEREQFGSQLARFDAIQRKLGDVDARTRAAEALLARVAGDAEAGEADAAAVKLMASEAAMFASDEAVQIFGGYGYMRDYPVERLMRDAKGLEVLGGTSESLRRVLAEEMLTSGA